MSCTAHRVKWVNTFAVAERWKEEIIRVTEEMRRLVAWHEYKIRQLEEALQNPMVGGSWTERGHLARQQELLNEWKSRLRALPEIITNPPPPQFQLRDLPS
jgi:hypothetical protein